MPWGFAIAAVGTIAGSAISANAAGNAADKQAQAAQSANQTQLYMYDQNRTDQAPWRAAGGSAVNALSSYYGLPTTNADGTTTPGNPNAGADDTKLIQSLPGYQFNLDEGNKAVQHNLAAQGLLGSGAAGKALEQYGQNYAMGASTQYLNGLQSLAGLGQTATQATGASGTNAANQIGSNQIYAGNAQASGYANQANAIGSGLSGLSGIAGRYASGGGGGGGGSGWDNSYSSAGGQSQQNYLNSLPNYDPYAASAGGP